MRDDARRFERKGFSGVTREKRFGIEEIHRRRTAVHEEENDTLGFSGKRRRLGFSGGFTSEQGVQGEGSESGSGTLQHFPSGKREACSVIAQVHGYSTYKNSLEENNTRAKAAQASFSSP